MAVRSPEPGLVVLAALRGCVRMGCHDDRAITFPENVPQIVEPGLILAVLRGWCVEI